MNKLKIGILINLEYKPSFCAGEYIKDVLKKEGFKTKFLSIEDVVDSNFNCNTVFNVYYGDIGDGGMVSGILEKNKVAFIGNSQYTCSIMFNKVVAKKFFVDYGYLTPEYWYKPNTQKSSEELKMGIKNKLGFPLLVKPVNGATSENIHFIKNNEQLDKFIRKYRIFIDNGFFFFEKFIKGKELSAAYVLSLKKLLSVIEIKLKKDEYQSNKVKFLPGLKENILPARINSKIYQQVQEMARDLSKIFCCQAFSRIDLIHNEKEKKIYILEINSNPGLLKESLLPLLVKSSGVEEGEFFRNLIEQSLLRKK